MYSFSTNISFAIYQSRYKTKTTDLQKGFHFSKVQIQVLSQKFYRMTKKVKEIFMNMHLLNMNNGSADIKGNTKQNGVYVRE